MLWRIVNFEAPIAEMVHYQSPNATEDVKNETNSDGECRKWTKKDRTWDDSMPGVRYKGGTNSNS